MTNMTEKEEKNPKNCPTPAEEPVVVQEVIHSQLQNFTTALAKFDEAPICPFLQSV